MVGLTETDSIWIVLLGFLVLFGVPNLIYALGYHHRAWQFGWRNLYRISRTIRARATAVSTIGTLSVVMLGLLTADLEPIVLVTLFYATALFFTNFLQSERPYPVVSFEREYYDDSYGEGDAAGFQYEFGLKNNGTTTLIDPTVEYRLYDDSYLDTVETDGDGWIEHEDTSISQLNIEPGEQERFEIEYAPVTHDGETDYYLCVKVSPRVQYREVTLLFVRRIIADD